MTEKLIYTFILFLSNGIALDIMDCKSGVGNLNLVWLNGEIYTYGSFGVYRVETNKGECNKIYSVDGEYDGYIKGIWSEKNLLQIVNQKGEVIVIEPESGKIERAKTGYNGRNLLYCLKSQELICIDEGGVFAWYTGKEWRYDEKLKGKNVTVLGMKGTKDKIFVYGYINGKSGKKAFLNIYNSEGKYIDESEKFSRYGLIKDFIYCEGKRYFLAMKELKKEEEMYSYFLVKMSEDGKVQEISLSNDTIPYEIGCVNGEIIKISLDSRSGRYIMSRMREEEVWKESIMIRSKVFLKFIGTAGNKLLFSMDNNKIIIFEYDKNKINTR
ncbi:MAG: hypothetical protein N2746_10065 [Deltaproteobacteria bacterium]|nr:hypothetical protein [Deltaproteobacteria bacterium]